MPHGLPPCEANQSKLAASSVVTAALPGHAREIVRALTFAKPLAGTAMPPPTLKPSYVDAIFIAEAEQVDGAMMFTEGARKLGFTDAKDRAQIAKFMAHLSPTGERLVRWQANSPDYVYCPIPSVTASVNAWLKTLSHENYSKFMAEVMRPSVDLYFRTVESRCFVRETVNGIQRSTKANLVGLIALHGFARDGNCSAHAHPMFWRFGITEAGSVKSFADRRFVPRMIQTASEVFHLSVASGISERFGYETRVKNSKCEMVGVSKAALESVGKRKQEMLAYLESIGVEPTPAAMAFAAVNTRAKEKKAYTVSERLRTWNQEAGKVDLSAFGTPDPSAWGARLKAMIDEFILQPVKVFMLAYKRTIGKHPGTVKVKDVTAFLEDTRARTRAEGHKAAVRALYRTNLHGFKHALKVAEAGYKLGRKPPLTLPVGARVVISERAARDSSSKQLAELKKRANQNGWRLRIGGQSLADGCSMSQ